MAIWVDTDMGADDLFAVLMVMREAEVAGMSLCFGVARMEQARKNASGASAAFGWSVPVYAGAQRALFGGVHTAERILGPTGMRSRGRTLPEAPDVVREYAVDAMAEWLEGEEDAEFLALGPLTNLALLLLTREDLAARIGRITWMGGGIARGNHTEWAEFNAFADPEALSVLLAHGAPLRMVDLDACRQVEVDEDDVAALRSRAGGASGLLADLLGGYVDVARRRGRDSMALYDPVAAAAVLRPEWFRMAPARVEVAEFYREKRGQTTVETGRVEDANAETVASLDAAKVKRLCLSALQEAG